MADRDPSLDVLRAVAPGTPLRNAIDLILRQETGALIVLGYGRDIEAICSGGFHLDGADFAPARLAELAKMDGAVITDEAAEVIYRANVHLIPDPSIGTSETGTRHRTAERVAVQTGRPVIVVSEGRQTVNVYVGSRQFELRSPTALLAQANQNLLTLERFRRRLTDDEDRLTQLEVDDIVVYRDVAQILQRAALVRRIGRDLDHYAVELGGEGELIRLQLVDLLTGVSEMAELVYSDYSRKFPPKRRQPLDLLQTLSTEHLSDTVKVAAQLDLGGQENPARSRGLRILARMPRLPESVKASLVEHFGTFQKLLYAGVGELDQVEGVGRTRARQLRHYFDRLLDSTRIWDFDEE
ncbi:MAG: DNA integrity scanning protein DisA [Actinobacteria bacterium RBG_16_68_21]|nr:MAG: DNA integrity scanning protein DisA [Actinobacteria bacterium RBG_16_68_21]